MATLVRTVQSVASPNAPQSIPYTPNKCLYRFTCNTHPQAFRSVYSYPSYRVFNRHYPSMHSCWHPSAHNQGRPLEHGHLSVWPLIVAICWNQRWQIWKLSRLCGKMCLRDLPRRKCLRLCPSRLLKPAWTLSWERHGTGSLCSKGSQLSQGPC